MSDNFSKPTNSSQKSGIYPPPESPEKKPSGGDYPQNSEDVCRQKATALAAMGTFQESWRASAWALIHTLNDLVSADGINQLLAIRSLVGQRLAQLDTRLNMAVARHIDFLRDFGGEEPGDLDQYTEETERNG